MGAIELRKLTVLERQVAHVGSNVDSLHAALVDRDVLRAILGTSAQIDAEAIWHSLNLHQVRLAIHDLGLGQPFMLIEAVSKLEEELFPKRIGPLAQPFHSLCQPLPIVYRQGGLFPRSCALGLSLLTLVYRPRGVSARRLNLPGGA